MKKLYFSLTLIFSSILISNTFNVNSQLSSTVDIGTGTVTNQSIPIEPYYGYTYSQSLYLASEIGGAIDPITAIQFYATTSTTLANSDLWDVWIKEVPTTFANFNNATNFEDITTFTQVFSGQVTINNGVVRIEFSTPFTYTGTGNIIIAVDQNKPGYDSNGHDFYCSNDGTNDARAIAYRSDGTNPNPLNPPTGSSVGGKSNYPNITFISEQQSVDIGTGTVTGQAIPVEPYYGYTYSQSLYLASEMGGASGPITGVKFYATPATTLANSDLWDVWIKEVPNTFANFNTQNFEEISTFTQVFNGQVTINNGVVRVDFSSPFQYTGSGNIIIAVDQNRPGYDSGSHDFYCTGSGNGDYRAVAYRSDGTNPNPATAHTVFAGVNNGRTSYPNITFLSESCSPTTSLTASNVTTSSADISWTASGTETAWEFEYGVTGFTATGSGTSASATTASISGLSPITTYDFYVRADCGGSTSSWTGPFTFTTPCLVAASPYLEDFDAGFPVCWSQPTTDDFNWTLDANGTGSTGTGPSDDISGGGNYMYIEASGGTNGNEAVLLSQEIDLSTLVNGQLRFFSHMYGSEINTLTVDISLDAGATFTQVFTKTGDQGDQWNEELVNISSYTGNAMFKITASQGSGFAGDIAIDDFEIRNNTVCSQPTALVASNLSANTADISWIAGGSEPSWNFEFGANGYTQGTGGTASTVSSSATIADNPNSLFANGPAAWPHVLTACLANQGASSQLAQTVTINVTSLPSGGTNYQKYKTLATGNNLSGAIPLTLGLNTLSVTAVTYDRTVKFRFDNDGFSFDEITLNGVSVYSSAFTSLSGLTPNTSYDVYVQADCGTTGSITGQSNWTGPVTFLTSCIPVSAPFSEDFLSGALPTCWIQSTQTPAWLFSSTSAISPAYDAASNGRTPGTYAWIDFNNGIGPAGDLRLPDIDVSTLTSTEFSFDYFSDMTYLRNLSPIYANAQPARLIVEYKGSNGTWISSDTLQVSVSGWNNYAFDLTGLDNNNILSIRLRAEKMEYYANYGDILLDDILVRETPSCFNSTALSASNISATTADLSWTGNGSSFNIEYGTLGFVQGTGNTVVVNSATIATQSSLFTSGSAPWPHVYALALTSDGVSSQSAQTISINVTSLPSGGANWRLIKQNQTTGASFVPNSNGQALVLGLNTLTAPASTWTRYVKAQFDTDNVGISLISVNGNSNYTYSGSYSISGLSASTDYDFIVQTDCGAQGTSGWSSPFTFTTACAAASSPYLENFDAAVFPVCWTQSTADDFNWTLDASGTPSGSTGPSDDITVGGNYMYIETSSSNSNGDSAVLLSQAIDLSALTSPELRFYSHMYGASINTLTVDISTDAGTTFTQVFTKTGDQGNQWNEELVSLSSYSGTVLFRITASKGSSYTGDIAIDDFEIRETPACSAPTSLSASNLTTNSADLSWTAGGTETAWNFEYGPVGFTQGSGTSFALTSANTSLTGLAVDTQYDAYVQADCGRGSTSIWVGPYTFSTLPNPVCYYTLNMIDSYGDSWNGGSIDVSINGAYAASFSNPSSAGAGQIYTDSIGAFTGDSVSFSWTSGSYDSEVSFEILDPNFTSLTAGYISAPSAGFFLADANSPSVCAPPACQVPVLLTASNLTSTSANISWTAGGTETAWNFEYGSVGFTQGTGTLSALTSANTSLTGLTAQTQYDVYVQADCGGSTSGWAGPYTFTTPCDLLTTFPYTMDFENGFGCWDVLDLASSNTWQLNSGSGINASISARIQYSSTAHNDYLISPKFSVTANSSRFSFNSRNGSSFYDEKFDVLLSTTGKAAADFTDTLATGVVPPTSYEYYQYDLSSYIGQDVFVSIHATEQDQLYLYVDDVTIDEFISKTILQSETSCDTYTWSVNGTSYTSDTSLTVFSPAVDVTDSDSTFILNLTVNSSTSSTETITACDSLQWYGNTYFASDSTATASLQTSSGCDSIVTLNLTINNSSVGIETVVACDSSTWNGTTYTTSGNYSLTGLTNNVNCDSTSNLVLTVNYSSSSLLTTTACNTFTWKGSTFTSSGVYVAPAGTNFAGCPQVDSLDLTITTIATSDTQTACDSYTWDGNTYTTSGTYYSSSACVDTLYLTVNASSSSSSTVAACDSSVWNGITYFTSGTYNVFTTNAAGCDSTATLNLTVGNSASNTVTVSECDSYNWNGTTYTSSGVYSEVFQTSTGCDSTVNLVLTINSSSNQSVTVFSCDEYTWDGVSYTASGDYTNNYTSVSGCDSTVTLVLTIGTTAAPFTEGFDINFPNCWSQPDSTDGEDALDWTRNSFATLSQGTGPSDDVIGGGHYMYIESSSPAQHGDNAIMYSNFIDISSLTNPELRFFSHMYGESTGSLTVEIQGENDTVPTTIFSKSGDHGDLWVQERVIFNSTSNRVKFKITGVLDSNSLGAVWAGDMAIDEFGVREAVPNDLAIIAAAVNSDCELTTTEPIELWVVNNGLVDQADFKLSYSINGGAPVLDSIIQFVNIGDTLRHIFTTTADMSMDGIYDIDFACILAIDADATDNVLNFVAENYTTPADAVTEGDTICFVGDFGQISAISDGWIYWYDSLVGGSLVGENDTLFVSPSATTSYFAEVSVYNGFEEDFESYSPGDLIAQSSNDWNTWSNPNGGADDDAEVTDFVSAGGSNSLYLNDDNSDDIVLPLGNSYSSGTFYFETDMYIETEAYLNFQEDVVNGDAWAFDLYFTETEIKVEIDDSTVLTVAYNPNNPLGAPIWFNFSLEADLDNGQWKMSKDGVSIGAFTMSDPISSVNFWASTGNNYYIDNVKWSAWGGDACRSLSRTEAVVVLDSCNTTSVSDVSFENLKIYPNPNNGSFTIANSELINSVVIMDLQGKVVYRNSNLNLYNLNVNLENLDRGMYMINIISENEITTKSIILN